RHCCCSEVRLVSVMKRPLSLKDWCFIGVAACHRVLGRDRGGIVLRGERRKGGIGFVVDHRHPRCICAKDERCSNCDHGLGRHRRGSYFEMSLSAIEFAQMRREVTCLEFTTTCSTRCQVWTNESLRAPNEVAAGREHRPHRRQSTPWGKPHSGTLAGSPIDPSCSWSGTTGSPGKCCSYDRRSDPPERRGDSSERRGALQRPKPGNSIT